MSITVKDILSLPLLKNAELAAGESGLSREVLRVNFTDSPLNPENPGYALVSRGDLYIHSFYTDMENEDQIYNLIQFYIQTESACCLAIKAHLQKLPEKVLRLAEKKHYPILMLDGETPYGELIKSISELLLTEQLDLHSENKINRLLYENLSFDESEDILRYLIRQLPSRYYCAFISFAYFTSLNFQMLKTDLSKQFGLSLLRYQKGGFFVFDAVQHSNTGFLLQSLYPVFQYYKIPFHIGISSLCTAGTEFSRSFKEAFSAYEISLLTNTGHTFYDDVSVYNLLLPLRNQQVLLSFCRETLTPLVQYSKKHSVDLLETIQVYFQVNGSCKKAASRLNTHENTVRFRITKAKALLGLEQEDYVFIERLSLALKAVHLLKISDYEAIFSSP